LFELPIARAIYLYDVTSVYFEGVENELADFGYNRDGKKGKKQLVAGLLTDGDGEPISIELYHGNTGDPPADRRLSVNSPPTPWSSSLQMPTHGEATVKLAGDRKTRILSCASLPAGDRRPRTRYCLEAFPRPDGHVAGESA
jgi:hypothetical protein